MVNWGAQAKFQCTTGTGHAGKPAHSFLALDFQVKKVRTEQAFLSRFTCGLRGQLECDSPGWSQQGRSTLERLGLDIDGFVFRQACRKLLPWKTICSRGPLRLREDQRTHEASQAASLAKSGPASHARQPASTLYCSGFRYFLISVETKPGVTRPLCHGLVPIVSARVLYFRL